MHWYDWFLYTSPRLVHSSCRQTCRARGHVAHADSGRVAHEGAEMESEDGSQLEFQTDYGVNIRETSKMGWEHGSNVTNDIQ